MFALFVVFLLIDVLIALYLFKLAFIQRSNMNRKYRRQFLLSLLVIGSGMAIYGSNLRWACIILGVPAVLVVLFILGLGIALFSSKGNWR